MDPSGYSALWLVLLVRGGGNAPIPERGWDQRKIVVKISDCWWK
jgi:hypothetical protein